MPKSSFSNIGLLPEETPTTGQEETGELDLTSFNETVQALASGEPQDLEPSADIINLSKLSDAERIRYENEIMETVNTWQSQTVEDLYKIPPAELTGPQLDRINEDVAQKIKAQLEDDNTPAWLKGIYGTILAIIAPLVNLMANTAVPNERHLIQSLKQQWRPALLDPQTLIRYWFRNRDSKDKITDDMEKQGFKDEDIDILLKVSEMIPGPQDVVSFMVREVYNEQATRIFKTDEGFDRLFSLAKKDADNAGVSEDVLRKFWRSHWRLPGIVQGFEMLHRGRIDIETLELLLRSADIMPGFIQPLIDISYSPLTRVDVRRMRKLNVLTYDQMVKAYKDLGYNDENAKNLADFTEEYNKDSEDSEKTAADKRRDNEINLTKGDILSMYKIKLITRNTCRGYLLDLGFHSDEVDLYIDRVDFQADLDLIDLRIKTIRKAYINGVWDRVRVITELDKLHLPTEQRDVLIQQWDIETDVKPERPTKAEVLSFLKKGIMTEPQARLELSAMGYNDVYIDMYIKNTKG